MEASATTSGERAATRAGARARLAPRRLLGDERLARLAAQGDTAAFELIFKRHHQELYRYCRAILSSSHDAQDALQSTMAAALHALPGEGRSIALRPWLFRVAHNEAVSIARRRRDSPLQDDPRRAPGADLDAERRERVRGLVADLELLPERQRSALVMRELSDLGYAEIAAALDASQGAARQLVYEAREAMREAGRGRELECPVVREAISIRDGRLRGRGLRAHLRTCEPCRDFRLAISQRHDDLRALAPPLPEAAAGGLIAAALGGKAGGGAGLGAAAGAGGIGAGGLALTKTNALIAAAILGTGAAGMSGAVDVPLVGGEGAGPAGTEAPAAPGASPAHGIAGERGPATGVRDASIRFQGSGRPHPAARPGAGERSSRGAAARANAPAGANAQGPTPGGGAASPAPPAHAVGGPPPSAGTGAGNAGGSSSAAPAAGAAGSRASQASQGSGASTAPSGPQASESPAATLERLASQSPGAGSRTTTP